MGGDGSHMMFQRSFPGLSKLKFIAFLFLICLCLLVEPHPLNGYNPPLREEDFFCVTCFVSVCVCLLAWFLRFDMSFILCFGICLHSHIS
jgi:hypothetical protein